MGWTADWTGNQGGCNPGTYCQLKVHYAPNPVTGHWGSTQTFRLHPGLAVTDDNALMVGRWAVNDAYWVKKGFFAAWLGGLQGIGLAAADEIPYCPGPFACRRYQRFSHGYIWEHLLNGVQPAVFCPDVTLDNYVRMADVSAVVNHYADDDHVSPWEAWTGSWYDMEGNGTIRMSDVTAVVNNYGMDCYPQ